jgi:hypothetical protein
VTSAVDLGHTQRDNLDPSACRRRSRTEHKGESVTQYSHPYQPSFTGPARAIRPSGSPLPVISIVLSALALLGVISLAFSGALDAGGDAPLTGQLDPAPSGALRGDTLVDDLSAVIRDDGGDVSDLRCPDTPSVQQGVVTLCHGTISGAAWAVAVFFEDSQGRFTALPM